MRQVFISVGIVLLALSGCESMKTPPEHSVLEQQVEAAERAFAKTMADRDFEAFRAYLSEEAVFFSGDRSIRGKQQVSEAWRGFYEGAEAPFSWKPEIVEVLDSGSLALSSGPVYNAQGEQIGIFNSIWRQEAPGTWRVVFDKGGEVCE